METMSSSDENFGMAYHHSSSTNQSTFAYGRSYSKTSGDSDSLNENKEVSASVSNSHVVTKSGSHNQATLTRLKMKQHKSFADDDEPNEQESIEPELEMMKERFAKLLLGEDMSGNGKGVCSAVTVSNAITNLYATVFGQTLRLEPLQPEKKALWRREMNCLLSTCDFIEEVVPSSLNSSDGTSLEVVETRHRTDIQVNLPALKKLDGMLIDVLDSFHDTEFWYGGKGGSASMNSKGSDSFKKAADQRKEEKWWVPVPCVPPEGLSEQSKRHLKHKRDCANQIHKAAMAINNTILSDLEIPESYIATLPKSGKASVGDFMYKYMSTGETFYPEKLLDGLNITTELEALELADKVEASIFTWRRKAGISYSKSSWDMMKDFVSENDRNDKNHVLAERAETLLFYLKHRYPALSQTSLDICKIQYNRDVGKATLESYSRVLEGFAFNLVSWIDDVLAVEKANQEE